MAAGEATLCAVYPDARNPFAFPDLFQKNRAVGGGRGVGPGRRRRNTWIDVDAAVDRKIAALMRHVSQHTDPQRTETSS